MAAAATTVATTPTVTQSPTTTVAATTTTTAPTTTTAAPTTTVAPDPDFSLGIQGVSAWTTNQQDLFFWYVTIAEVAGGDGTGPIQITFPGMAIYGIAMPGGTGWTFSTSAGAYVLTYGPGLAAGQSSTLEVRFDAPDTLDTMTVSGAIGTGSGGDSNPGNNSASATLTVPG